MRLNGSITIFNQYNDNIERRVKHVKYVIKNAYHTLKQSATANESQSNRDTLIVYIPLTFLENYLNFKDWSEDKTDKFTCQVGDRIDIGDVSDVTGTFAVTAVTEYFSGTENARHLKIEAS